jgi:hypothetical protein
MTEQERKDQDAEAHGYRLGAAPGTDEPPKDQKDAAGHLVRRATDDTEDEPDAEGHPGARRFARR